MPYLSAFAVVFREDALYQVYLPLTYLYLCGNVGRCKQERNQLSITLTNLQVDFDNLNARFDEEAETSASLRAQLQRAQADYQALKGKYDKEVTARIEEFEETR